jgi:hypothetical protein
MYRKWYHTSMPEGFSGPEWSLSSHHSPEAQNAFGIIYHFAVARRKKKEGGGTSWGETIFILVKKGKHWQINPHGSG